MKKTLEADAKESIKALLMERAQEAIVSAVPAGFMAAFEIDPVELVCQSMEEIVIELRRSNENVES